jgi:hypothetical protein
MPISRISEDQMSPTSTSPVSRALRSWSRAPTLYADTPSTRIGAMTCERSMPTATCRTMVLVAAMAAAAGKR